MCRLSYRFIYLLGPEGVGKTTIARLLRSRLASAGYRVKVIHIRTRHLAVNCFKYFVPGYFAKASEDPQGYWTTVNTKDKNFQIRVKRLKKLFPIILLLEVTNTILLSLIRVFIPLLLNYVVIAESYVINTMADLQHVSEALGISENLLDTIKRILFRLMPKHHIVIFLDASYEELVRRYRKRQTRIEPPGYIYSMRNTFLDYARMFNTRYINTEDKSIPEVLREIKELVMEA